MIIAISIIAFLVFLAAPILLVRFRKRQVAAFHRAITNPIANRFATRLPGFGVVTNVGRKSGRVYRTPVNVFWEPNGFLIALTYGPDSGWVKNVLASGGCQLETRGVLYHLCMPTVIHDPTRRQFPVLVRVILGLISANDFLRLSTSDANKVSS